MLLPYCLFKAGDTPASLVGVGGLEVKYLQFEGIFMAYSDLGELNPRELLLQHTTPAESHPAVVFEHVIVALHRDYTAIPIRFGEVIEDIPGARVLLSQHAASIHRTLNQLGDKMEIVFKVDLPDASQNELPEKLKKGNSKGVAYLRKRYEQLSNSSGSTTWVKDLEQAVVSQYQESLFDHKVEIKANQLSIFLLLLKGQSFNETAFAKLQKKIPETTIVYKGSFPPYHFVRLQLKG